MRGFLLCLLPMLLAAVPACSAAGADPLPPDMDPGGGDLVLPAAGDGALPACQCPAPPPPAPPTKIPHLIVASTGEDLGPLTGDRTALHPTLGIEVDYRSFASLLFESPDCSGTAFAPQSESHVSLWSRSVRNTAIHAKGLSRTIREGSVVIRDATGSVVCRSLGSPVDQFAYDISEGNAVSSVDPADLAVELR